RQLTLGQVHRIAQKAEFPGRQRLPVHHQMTADHLMQAIHIRNRDMPFTLMVFNGISVEQIYAVQTAGAVTVWVAGDRLIGQVEVFCYRSSHSTVFMDSRPDRRTTVTTPTARFPFFS